MSNVIERKRSKFLFPNCLYFSPTHSTILPTHTCSLTKTYARTLTKFVRMNGRASTEKQSVSLILRILSSKKLGDLGIRTSHGNTNRTDARISLINANALMFGESVRACLCKHILLKLNQTNRPRFANTFLLGMLCGVCRLWFP